MLCSAVGEQCGGDTPRVDMTHFTTPFGEALWCTATPLPVPRPALNSGESYNPTRPRRGVRSLL